MLILDASIRAAYTDESTRIPFGPAIVSFGLHARWKYGARRHARRFNRFPRGYGSSAVIGP